MSETQAPRVWIAGNPEPSDVRLRVRDKHGDIWTPEQVLGGVRAWSTPETALATWDYLAKKWGPLTEVTATSLGVSGEDRSEPTPVPREWVFGFGPKGAERAWRCQRCREVMRKNQRACPACAYTVFDPVHREVVSPEGTS